MSKKINLQEMFLNTVRKNKTEVEVYLPASTPNGGAAKVAGTVVAFDEYTILMQTGHKINLIYKQSVSSILPTKPMKLDLFDGIEQIKNA